MLLLLILFESNFNPLTTPTGLILNVANPTGKFWDGVSTAGDNFEIIGGAICGAFVFFGVGSVILYRPWRRRYDRRPVTIPEPVELKEQEKNVDSHIGEIGEVKDVDMKWGR